MLILTLKHEGNKPPRMSTVLATCANALMAEGYSIYYSPDGHSLVVKESDNPFPPRKAFPPQLPASAYNAMKALLGYEEERRAQLLEDQGGKDGK